MTEYFISPSARALDAWRKAFSSAVVLGSAEQLPALAADDLVWVDVELDDWAGTVRSLTERGVRVVVVSALPADEQALLALDSGARGYCHAFAAAGLFHEVALVVRHGGLWVGPHLLARLITGLAPQLAQAPEAPAAPALDELSPREREVTIAVAEGLTNKQVALRLDISERTVKAHLSAIFEKLGVPDRLQLALLVSRVGAQAQA